MTPPVGTWPKEVAVDPRRMPDLAMEAAKSIAVNPYREAKSKYTFPYSA